jgi:hypothetical protein
MVEAADLSAQLTVARELPARWKKSLIGVTLAT